MERIAHRYIFVCIWLFYALFSGLSCYAGAATSDGLSAAMSVQACDFGANAAHASTAFQPVCVVQSCWLLGKGCLPLTLLASVASFLLGRYTADRRFRKLAVVAEGVLFRNAASPLVKVSDIALSWSNTLLASIPAVAVEPVKQCAGWQSASEGTCQDTVTINDYIGTCRNNSSIMAQSTLNNTGSTVNTGSDDPLPDSTPFGSSSNDSSNSNSNSTSSSEQLTSMPSNLATGWTCVFSDTADSRGNSSSSNTGAVATADPRVIAVGSNNASGSSQISLGVLLGAGAFGKVYQGSWRGSPVAVKVITQLGSLAAQLTRREAELMLQAKHPNVVQTYHVVIWQRINPTGSGIFTNSNTSASSSSGRLVQGGSGATTSSNCTSSSAGSKSAESSGSSQSDCACAAAGGQCCSSSIVSNPAAAAAETAHCWPVGDSGGECELEFEFEGEQITRDSELETQTWMVQQLCDAGTLDHAARDGKVDHPMAQVSCLLDISRGMQYLHSNHIMHGDLKCSNICLRKKHQDLARVASSSSSSSADGDLDALQFTCKVADFSLTRTIDAGKDHHSTKSLGTVTHLAPELLTDGRQTPACDVYSFGMLVWELLHKKPPFSDCLHEVEVLEKIVVQKERPAWNHQGPSGCQDQAGLTAGLLPDLISLAEQCWDQDPSKRPTFAEICSRLQQMQQDLSTSPAAARASAVSRAAASRFSTVKPNGESGSQGSVDRSVNVSSAAATAPYGASSSSSSGSSSSSSGGAGSVAGFLTESASSASQGMQMRRSHSLGTGKLSRISSSDLDTIPEQRPVTNDTSALSALRSTLVRGRRSADGELLLSTNVSTPGGSSGGRRSLDTSMPEDIVMPIREAAPRHPGKGSKEKHRTRRHGQLITESATGQLIVDPPTGTGYEAFARWLLGAEGIAQLQEQQKQQQQMQKHGVNYPVTSSHVTNHRTSHMTGPGKREAVSEGTGLKGVTWIPRATSQAEGKPTAPHSGYWE